MMTIATQRVTSLNILPGYLGEYAEPSETSDQSGESKDRKNKKTKGKTMTEEKKNEETSDTDFDYSSPELSEDEQYLEIHEHHYEDDEEMVDIDDSRPGRALPPIIRESLQEKRSVMWEKIESMQKFKLMMPKDDEFSWVFNRILNGCPMKEIFLEIKIYMRKYGTRNVEMIVKALQESLKTLMDPASIDMYTAYLWRTARKRENLLTTERRKLAKQQQQARLNWTEHLNRRKNALWTDEVAYYQQSTELLLDKEEFYWYAIDAMDDYIEFELAILSRNAALTLQAGTEHFLVKLLVCCDPVMLTSSRKEPRLLLTTASETLLVPATWN